VAEPLKCEVRATGWRSSSNVSEFMSTVVAHSQGTQAKVSCLKLALGWKFACAVGTSSGPNSPKCTHFTPPKFSNKGVLRSI
jgi:hypothetical protein